MNKIKIEFFHDVICSFCFPMSYRMRKLQEIMPEVEIKHRSYALVKSEEDFDVMFGSRAAAKGQILSHWEQANQNDDLHRFNISAMEKTEFPFPSSVKSLVACKAAWLVSSDEGYWDLFDGLQKALFVEARNIDHQEVIDQCVKAAGIDYDLWLNHYNSKEAFDAVEKDLQLVEEYGIQGVPCLIVDGKHQISGAQPLDKIIEAIEQHKPDTEGGACRITDGKADCQ